MGGLIRGFDWAATPLGPLRTWPAGRRVAVEMVLATRFPSVLAWGPGLVVCAYNDAYRALLRDKPLALGLPFLDLWPEVRRIIEPQVAKALAGEAMAFADAPFTVVRSGVPEEVFFDYCLSPVRDEHGQIAGLLNTAIETTGRILVERRRDAYEAELRLKEEPLQLIADNVPALIGYHDRELRYVFVNEAFARFFGVPREQIVGRKVREQVGERVFERLRPGMEAALAGRAVRFEDKEPDKFGPGLHGWTDENYVPRFAPDGSVEGFYVLAVDITDRKRAETMLKSSEARLRLALEVGRLATWDWNVETGDVAWSDEHYRAYGYGVGDITPSYEAWIARVHPEDRAATEAALAEARAGRKPYAHEFRALHPDGEVRFFAARGIFFYDDHGRPARMIGVMEEVTERKRREAALRESDERLRLIVESALDYAILISDPRDLITDWFPGAQAVFGWSADEIIGLPGAVLFTPEDREAGAPEREVEMARRDGSTQNVRWHLRKDGTPVFIEGTVRALVNPDGSPRGFLRIGQDVTERRAREEALEASERHAKLLLAELQHRVRNTLGVVRSIVRRTAATSDTVEDFASHLDGRINAFARVQAAATRDPSTGIDLEMLVAETLRAHGAHEGVQVTEISGPPVRLRAKPAETLALALHELAINAVKYGALSSEGGRIQVTWSRHEGHGEPRLAFSWVETGLALDSGPPQRRGFGTELIERTLAYDLKGEATLSFERQGLRCTIDLPLGDAISLQEG